MKRFADFKAECDKEGVEAIECNEHHWKAVGVNEVNFWPNGRNGSKFLVKGVEGKARRGSIREVVAAALNGKAVPVESPIREKTTAEALFAIADAIESLAAAVRARD